MSSGAGSSDSVGAEHCCTALQTCTGGGTGGGGFMRASQLMPALVSRSSLTSAQQFTPREE